MRQTTFFQRLAPFALTLSWGSTLLFCAQAAMPAAGNDAGHSAGTAATAPAALSSIPTSGAAANISTDSDFAAPVETLTDLAHKLSRSAPIDAPGTSGASTRLTGSSITTMPAATRPAASSSAAVDGTATEPAKVIARVAPPQERLPLGRSNVTAPDKSAPAAGAEPSWWVTTAMALGIVVGLILILRGAVKRWSGRSGVAKSSPLVEVLARVAVAPRNHVMLVRLGGRVLVLGDSQAGLQLLANIEEPEEVAGLLAIVEAGKPGSISRGFGQLMRKMTGEANRNRELDDRGTDVGEFLVDHTRDELSGLTARLRTLGRQEGRA